MEKINKKPQLHSSHLSMLSYCGYKFQMMVLEGKKEPATTPLIIGTASHAVNALNISNKIEKGTLLTKEAVQDFSRDLFLKEWHASAVTLNEEEVDQGLNKTRDMCQDSTIAVCTEYHYAIAPKLKPVAVEEKWVLEAIGFPYDLAGTVDVREKYFKKDPIIKEKIDEILNLRDTKTRGRDLGQKEVDSSMQYTLYAMAFYYIYGRIPDNIYQDTLIKPTKTMPARAIIYPSKRTKDDFEVFNHRFEAACHVIDKQAFTPANPSHFLCSKEFCGFAAAGTCKYFNSKRGTTVSMVKPKQEEQENGTKETNTSALKSILANNKDTGANAGDGTREQ